MSEPSVVIGRIGAPRGVEGEFRVTLEIDDTEAFARLTTIAARRGTSPPEDLRIERVDIRTGNREAILKCEGIGTREEALAWNGAALLVNTSDLPPLPQGHFYYFQIEGLAVRTEDGRHLGTVDEIMPVPQGEIYIVREGGKEILIPSAGEFVRSIDPERQVMVVRLIEGMEPT